MTSHIKASRSALAEGLLYLDGKKVSFKNYPFHYAVYDGAYPSLLKCTSRQVGKTVGYFTTLTYMNGRIVQATDVKLGDEIATLLANEVTIGTAVISTIFNNYSKPGLRITTRQGHIIDVAATHPFKTWKSWTPAGDLKVGTRIAAARRAGVFTGTCTYPLERIRLTAYMLGDGHIGDHNYDFTSMPGAKFAEFFCDAITVGNGVIAYPKRGTKAYSIRLLRKKGLLRPWFKEDGLHDTRSGTKFIPPWVFDLSREHTALFLNRLWSTDGHVRLATRSQYDISYASISLRMIKEVQALLLKFGVPSKIRKKWPNYHKSRGVEKYAYELRVETQAGVRIFLTEIGAIGKSENVPIPTLTENNNQDTFPDELKHLIKEIAIKGDGENWHGTNTAKYKPKRDTLFSNGLHRSAEYPLTKTKLKKYIDFFRKHSRYDQTLVDELERHYSGDVYWDRVESIEPIGDMPCIDFEVKDTHNFIAEGLIVHNSTLASNFMISESIAKPFFRTLYVSPTKEQTSKFSNTRLSKTLTYSPLVRRRFSGYSDTDNVFLKVLSNGSEISLSYASDDPDRIRGISADRLFLDEVQDIDINAVLPVVKECISNSDYGYETFTGTPKSMENGIEILWQQSTQTEWIMKCPGCGKFNFINSEKSVGLKGPICLSCGHLLNPRDGKWYDMKPEARIKGFHISQPMLPLNCEVPARWERILDKKETYAPSKFKNEVLGVSDAIGTRMISKEELDALCDEKIILANPPDLSMLQHRIIAGGVDWSGGGTMAKSRTVVWIWGLQPDNKIKCLYYKIFPDSRNQVEDVREVINIFQTFRCQMVMGDAGEGAVANAMMRESLGEHRALQVQYGTLAKQISWNGKDRYLIDKTAFIDSFMLLLKRKGAVFANVRQMQPAILDILNEFEEVTQNGMGKKVWKHAPTMPDDALHAAIFGWIALRVIQGELQLYKT